VLSGDAGIDHDRIFAAFDLAPRRAVIAAVSGGSDSLGLLFLLEDFLATRAPQTRLVAVTVDHGLRAASAGEAGAVASLCAAHGIAHRTLAWTGDKPRRGLSAAAREARYRLLAQAADAEGSDIILTGHTLDDQFETVAMRAARGDGRGLAGMAPATLYDGRVWILRPLLKTARPDLRDFLTTRGVGWIDDPTNVDRTYERARVRAASAGWAPESTLAKIDGAAAARVAFGQNAAGVIRKHVVLSAPGLVGLELSFADVENRHAGALYALRILLATVGGTEQLPDMKSSMRLFTRLCSESFRTTLSRVVIDAAVPALYLRRERRSLPEASRPAPGEVWDGRFRVGELPEGMSLAPVGVERARPLARLHPRPFAVTPLDTSPSFIEAALAAEPGLWRGGEFAGFAVDAGAARRIIAPWARFLPSFDLALARAVAALIGADPIPQPPFAGHNGRQR
jgi:tRNA(Ile)-lysidine synthase